MYRDVAESNRGIRLSGGKCVVCGWCKKDFKGNLLVDGAHVRPLNNTEDYDKHDNIIALCPNHHREFDRGNITINSGTLIIKCINGDDEFHNRILVGKVNHIQRGYLDYHNKNIYRGKV